MLCGRRQKSKAGDGSDEKPWARYEDAAWADAVQAWGWLEIGDHEWETSGRCPWCTHGMKVEQSGAYVGAPVGAAEEKDDRPRNLYARCNCGEEHPGRPPEIKRGCGRWGLISPPGRK